MAWSSSFPGKSGLSGFQFLGGLFVLLISLVGYSFSGFLLDDALHLARITSHAPGSLTYSIDVDWLNLHLLSGEEPVTFEYVRPLTSLSMQIDYLLFGLRPLGFHLVNTLLHLFNVWLVFTLGSRLGMSAATAWATALMWGVSIPAGLATGWISGRSELLAATLVLSAMNAVLRHFDSGARRWLHIGSILLLLGTLAKESAVVGPALTLIFLMFMRNQQGARQLVLMRPRVQLALWGPIIVGLGFRSLVFGLPRIPQPYFQPPDSPAAAYTMLTKVVVYLLSGLSGLPAIPFVLVEAIQKHWYAPLLLSLVVVACLRIPFRFVSKTPGLLLLTWFVVALAPALFVMSFSIYLYLPLIGLYWMFGLAWQVRRPKLIKFWMGWLLTSGVLINVALGGCLIRLGHNAQAAQLFLDDILATESIEDVVIIDTPFWAYPLPVTARLRDPSLSFQTHFLNFSPSLEPGIRSDTSWVSESEFEIAAPGGCFFASPIERFFLFGNDPCGDGGSVPAFSISCLEWKADSPYPTALRVKLDRSIADPRLLVLQFDGWRLQRFHPFAGTGLPAPSSQ
jgi:hypothetical protein